MREFAFPKSARLLKSQDFDRVFHRKCVTADSRIVIYSAAGASPQSRLGLVISRKCGNAVLRNRWKRALREAFRLERGSFSPPLDLVVMPRRGAVPDVESLRKSFARLAGNPNASWDRVN